MNRPDPSSAPLFWSALTALVVVVAGCAEQQQRPTAASGSPAESPELEQIVVTGTRTRELNGSTASSGAALARSLLYSVGYAGGETEAAAGRALPPLHHRPVGDLLGYAAPDEEIWVIVRAREAAAPDEDSPGSGALLARPVDDEGEAFDTEQMPLPLAHTAVQAEIDGYIGTVDVVQQFENPFTSKIEAVYLFPLPEKAAVSEFVMRIGERRIRGILREREEAEQIYREARAEGFRASLLVQHRPNVFEQKVANIEPGERIDVQIRYFHTLAYVDGWYTFVFPTVVGPRYNPSGSANPLHAWSAGHHEQPAQGAAVRYLRPEQRSGHDISIEVELDAGVQIEDLRASHDIAVQRHDGDRRASIALAEAAVIPNEDFVLAFRVAGRQLKSALVTHREEGGDGYFTLMIYPPDNLERLERAPMEMVFVVDCSGSMHGQPIEQARAALGAALDRLRPGDTFQIIRFSDSASRFGPSPVPASPQNIRAARRYVEQLAADGGTQMMKGIQAALDFPHDEQRMRVVTFLTDGYIGNEADIIGEIHRRIGASRIFSFGVGSSVNRYLLERMAAEGRGAVAYLALDDPAEEVMALYFERISHPVLTDLEIDWRGLLAEDVYPRRLPDLFVGRPVVVTGRYSGIADRIDVTGRAGGEQIRFTIEPDPTADAPAVARVWARRRIAELEDRQAWQPQRVAELGDEIRQTALAFGLMSAYTSFVAVDASERTEGEFGTTVHQPVPVPRGVRYGTTVSEQP